MAQLINTDIHANVNNVELKAELKEFTGFVVFNINTKLWPDYKVEDEHQQKFNYIEYEFGWFFNDKSQIIDLLEKIAKTVNMRVEPELNEMEVK